MSNELSNHFEESKVQHNLTNPYTPQQNGGAEHLNRTLLDLVQAMLHHKQLGKEFWAEALQTAVYIRNRATNSAFGSSLTAFHVLHGKSPYIEQVRVFGCKFWYVTPKQKLQKLDEKSRCAVFVGYSEQSKA